MNTAFFIRVPLRFHGQIFLRGCLVVVTVMLTVSATAQGQVSETPNRWIRGVAQVTLDNNGKSQIQFNPARCRALGPDLCEFFRTHEYGHVNLRHLERGVPAPRAEVEADIWAARNASPSAVLAAKNFFLSGQGGSRVHGTPKERARRMDIGASSSASQTVTVQTSNNQKKPRAITRNAPKSYSATSNRRVRYYVTPRTSGGNSSQSAVRRKQVSRTPPKFTSTTAAPKASKTVRYVVRRSTKVSQSNRQVPKGFVPRGGFLNPR